MRKPKPLTRAGLKAHPLPPPSPGDKDSKGRVLILAGSRQVPGAALLAATAAMRAGAGKLKIATVESVAVPLAVAMPEALVTGMAEHRDGGFARSAVRDIEEVVGEVDAIVAGPGMDVSATCKQIARVLLDSAAQVVLDAALLHTLAPLEEDARGSPNRPILLPHAGELASLLECEEDDVHDDPIGCGLRAAQLYGALVLVKGVTSNVVSPDGDCWVHRNGAAGLGVSGSGDTLAGIVGGLLARGAPPLTALLWSVLLHGEAGAALSKKVGPVGFLAREIANEVPALLRR